MRYNPIEYRVIETNLLNTYKPYTIANWEDKNLIDVRKHIKNHLIKEQNNRCTYCKLPIFGTSYRQTDHIVPKGKHPQFLFHPKNLALACQVCNNKKSTKETLINTQITHYPRNGNAFKIVHAYFDKFNDHITLKYKLFLIGKTDKGRTTVIFCNLARLSLAESRATLLKRNKSPQLKKLVMIYRKTEDAVLRQQIKSFIDSRKRLG